MFRSVIDCAVINHYLEYMNHSFSFFLSCGLKNEAYSSASIANCLSFDASAFSKQQMIRVSCGYFVLSTEFESLLQTLDELKLQHKLKLLFPFCLVDG